MSGIGMWVRRGGRARRPRPGRSCIRSRSLSSPGRRGRGRRGREVRLAGKSSPHDSPVNYPRLLAWRHPGQLPQDGNVARVTGLWRVREGPLHLHRRASDFASLMLAPDVSLRSPFCREGGRGRPVVLPGRSPFRCVSSSWSNSARSIAQEFLCNYARGMPQQPDRSIALTSAKQMRALAHPLRLRISGRAPDRRPAIGGRPSESSTRRPER